MGIKGRRSEWKESLVESTWTFSLPSFSSSLFSLPLVSLPLPTPTVFFNPLHFSIISFSSEWWIGWSCDWTCLLQWLHCSYRHLQFCLEVQISCCLILHFVRFPSNSLRISWKFISSQYKYGVFFVWVLHQLGKEREKGRKRGDRAASVSLLLPPSLHLSFLVLRSLQVDDMAGQSPWVYYLDSSFAMICHTILSPNLQASYWKYMDIPLPEQKLGVFNES